MIEAPQRPQNFVEGDVTESQLANVSMQLWGEPHYPFSFLALCAQETNNSFVAYRSKDATSFRIHGFWRSFSSDFPMSDEQMITCTELLAPIPYAVRAKWEERPWRQHPEHDTRYINVEFGGLSRRGIFLLLENRRFFKFPPMHGAIGKGLAALALAAEVREEASLDDIVVARDLPRVPYRDFCRTIQNSGLSDRAKLRLIPWFWERVVLQASLDYPADIEAPEMIIEGRVYVDPGVSGPGRNGGKLSCDSVALETEQDLLKFARRYFR